MEIGGIPLPVGGGEKPTRSQYLAYLRGVVRARGIHLATWESVHNFAREGDGTFTLRTRFEPDAGEGRSIRARAVVLAIGVWPAPVTLKAKGADRPNVFSEFDEPTRFCGHPVLVVGGGNSAVGAALSLMEARAEVALSMRRPPRDYRSGLRPFVKRDLDFAVTEGKLKLLAETVVTEIGPHSATLQPVRYTGDQDLSEGTTEDYLNDGEPFSVRSRFVFALLGHRPDTRFLSSVMGLPLRADGRPEADPRTWATAIPNILLAGSLADRTIDIVVKIGAQAGQVVETLAARLKR